MNTRHAAALKALLIIAGVAILGLVATAFTLNQSTTGDGSTQRAAFQQLLDGAHPNADSPDNALPTLIDIADQLQSTLDNLNQQAHDQGSAAFADLAELSNPTTDETFREEALENAALARRAIQQLQDNGTLARLDTALDAEIIAPNIEVPPLLFQTEFTHTAPLRQLVSLQTARAAEALNATPPHTDRALDHIEDIITLASVSGSNPALIDQLVAIASHSAAVITWRRHADISNTTPQSLARSNTLFAAPNLELDMEAALDTERLFIAQYIDLTHDKSTGRLVPSAQDQLAGGMDALLPFPKLPSALDFIGIAFASRDESLEVTDQFLEQLKQAIDAPTAAERQRITDRAENNAFDRGWRHRVTAVMLPAIGVAARAPIRLERERRLTILHNAALLYQHPHDSPPTSTDDLTNNNLIDPALLTDPTNDQPLTLNDLNTPR